MFLTHHFSGSLSTFSACTQQKYYIDNRFSVISWVDSGALLSREELEQLPFLYRLVVKVLLKMPNPSLPFFVLKKFPEFEGILWAVVTPSLLILYFFFNIWLFSLSGLRVGFPINLIVIFGVMIPAVIFVFFLRIQIERTILWWRNIHEPQKEWDAPKRVEELIELFEKQRMRKKS